MKIKPIYILLIACAILYTLAIILGTGTGDAGDSVLHYLFAKHAPQHPKLYFHHWAKPVFTLLASPFAQFGFTGVKVFNALVMLGVLWFTYSVATALKMANALLAPLCIVFAPLCFVLTFSGLTEPLFALFTIASVYAVLRHKVPAAAVLVSFLPFVRSEGLIIAGVFGFYLLLKRNYRLLPLLAVGHVAFALAGAWVYGDILWVFTKIPYAKIDGNYGSGTWYHFVVQMLYVTGIPIYILLCIGILAGIGNWVKQRIGLEMLVLVFGGFFAFFLAHAAFWYFGLFNSLGLKRVLIGVSPLIALIALYGFNQLVQRVPQQKKRLQTGVSAVLVLYLLVFPFTSNPAAIHWKQDLMLSVDQQLADEAVAHIPAVEKEKACFVYAHPYLGEALEIDPFNPKSHQLLSQASLTALKPGDYVIWENWFAVVESGINKAYLEKDSTLQKIHETNRWNGKREIRYAVYQKQ